MRSQFDLHNNCTTVNAFDQQVIASDTTTVGNIIDTKDFNMLEILMISGTLTDGAYAVTLEHGDDSALADTAAVPAAEILGSISYALADDDLTKRIGYVGKKRYVRMSVVSTAFAATGGIFGGAIALLAAGMHNPQANQ